MVKSGLSKDPMVSPYRLTAHLLLAFAILAYVLKLCVPLLPACHLVADRQTLLRRLICLSIGMVVLTVCYGGFTAGLHAGKIYNTFPLMGGRWVPPELISWKRGWLSFLEEPVTVQFIHRWLATITFVLVIYTSQVGKARVSSPKAKALFWWLQAAVTIQLLLGIATLLLHVPIFWAVVHQSWAMVVFASLLWVYLALRPRFKENIR